jgi:hypothetical protein
VLHLVLKVATIRFWEKRTLEQRKFAMSPIVIEETVRILDRIVDLDSFRRWARSDEFPERGRFSFLDGELWIDRNSKLETRN